MIYQKAQRAIKISSLRFLSANILQDKAVYKFIIRKHSSYYFQTKLLLKLTKT